MPDSTLPSHMQDDPPVASENDYGVPEEERAQAVPKSYAVKVDAFRAPPCNFEAEKALLGALMANNRVLEKIPFLKPVHFADPIHTIVFEAMVKQIEGGRKSDLITLSHFFEKNDTLADVGGNDYLVELVASAVTIINAAEYARVVHDFYIKRELIHLGNEIINNAHCADVDSTGQQQREWAEAKLFELSETNEAQKARTGDEILQSTIQEIEAAYNTDGAIDGLRTGLASLDATLGGIPQSSLTILAGRPGMGKTALAIAMSYLGAALSEPQPGAFFSLEMGGEQILKRQISDKANVPHNMIRSGKYHEQRQYEDVVLTAQKLKTVPVYIDDSAGLSVAEIKARLRRLIRTHGVKICFIDYLTHIRPRDPKSPKVYQVEQITRDLKAMAKEFKVPVVLLCQLSRAVEQREDKRPLLSDLRDSGAIEQDADQVLFAYRKAYYLEREEPSKRNNESNEAFVDRQISHEAELERCKRECEIIVAKNRHGNTGTVSVHFDPAYQRVRDRYNDQEGMF